MENFPKAAASEQSESEEKRELSEDKKESAGEKVLKISFADWKEQRKPEAKEYIESCAQDIADVQDYFRKKIKRNREEGKGDLSETDFCKLEKDFADQWSYIQRELSFLELNHGTQEGMEFEAEAERAMFVEKELDETIEAQAGRFFEERSRALREAIENSDSETKEKDLDTLGSFLTSVAEHLDYRYIGFEEMRDTYGSSEYEMKRFDERRTDAHNNAIEHLNKLNHLAEKYGTTPFMARDLWTSKNQKQTPYMSKRMSYDRHVFESYYTHAFGNLVSRIKAEHDRYSSY